MLILTKGGGMMWAIVAASIIALSIIIERYLYYRKQGINPEAFLLRIKEIVKSMPSLSDIEKAIGVCDEVKSPLSSIFKVILINRSKNVAEIQSIVEAESEKIIPKLEERLTALNTIASIAPLMGLLGTVIGMIKSFAVISRGDIASASVAEGISQALFTTAAGLFVAIPCIIMYNFFARNVDLTVNEMGVYSTELIAHIKNQSLL